MMIFFHPTPNHLNQLTIVPSYLPSALVEVLFLVGGIFYPPLSFDRPANTLSRIGLN